MYSSRKCPYCSPVEIPSKLYFHNFFGLTGTKKQPPGNSDPLCGGSSNDNFLQLHNIKLFLSNYPKFEEHRECLK